MTFPLDRDERASVLTIFSEGNIKRSLLFTLLFFALGLSSFSLEGEADDALKLEIKTAKITSLSAIGSYIYHSTYFPNSSGLEN